MVVRETEKGKFERKVEEKNINDLPEGEVIIRVKYSSLNYKDALSATGNKGVTKNYPHTPGIDAAGIVEESKNPDYKKGDQVIVTGFDLGMNTSGGWGEYIRVPAAWLIRKPEGLTLKESMIYGTAGFTGALSVYQLVNVGKAQKKDGNFIISGASGGVGGHALRIMAKLGFKTIAVCGLMEDPEKEFSKFRKELMEQGADEVIAPKEVDLEPDKPLVKPRWAGGIDTVGGDVLGAILKATDYMGSVTNCGNAGGHKLNITVFPFILNGVNLLGIESGKCPMNIRSKIWEHLSGDWKADNLEDALDSVVTLEKLDEKIKQILDGKLTGRVVVSLEE
jgi:putative YhdH/YhfP family quinone oxidoreductase